METQMKKKKKQPLDIIKGFDVFLGVCSISQQSLSWICPSLLLFCFCFLFCWHFRIVFSYIERKHYKDSIAYNLSNHWLKPSSAKKFQCVKRTRRWQPLRTDLSKCIKCMYHCFSETSNEIRLLLRTLSRTNGIAIPSRYLHFNHAEHAILS